MGGGRTTQRATGLTPTQITVVIPTFNADPAFFVETLDSLVDQTLDRHLFDVIIVDDASTDEAAVAFLDQLERDRAYRGLAVQIIRHDENRWLAAARTTGAEAATTPFVLFLDDDDQLSRGYLEKCLLLLVASPDVAWVYANVRKFGQRNEFRRAIDFQFSTQFFRNDMPYAALFRRDVWLDSGQREVWLNETTRLFEDWDTYIRLMAKGHFGTPQADATFHYRRGATGLAYRSTREYAASIYLTYRLHFWRLGVLPRGWFRLRRYLRLSRADLRFLSPMRVINDMLRRFAQRRLDVHEFPGIFTGPMLRAALFDPDRFIAELTTNTEVASLATMRSGFRFAPDMSFTNHNPFPGRPRTRTLFVGHIWWQMGGAENILWHWINETGSSEFERVLEAVQISEPELDLLKTDFAAVADQQYDFSGFGQTPMQHLRSMWNLVCLHRPEVVLISSNSYLYALAPHIKRMFPDTKIVDILHNEFDGIVDWFTISADHDAHLDARIVTSDYWRDLLVGKYGVDPAKVVVADNPVDTERYDPEPHDRNEILDDFGMDPAMKTISFIGRLHPQKGLDVFLALASTMADRPDVQFLVAGDGELLDDVMAAAKHARNLHYIGYFPTVERVLAATDVLVCPSTYEGAPLIGLECAAMNTALIAPDIVGFREQLADGCFGISYHASMQIHDDARTIQKIIEERFDELIESGRNGREWVLGRHALPVVGEKYRSTITWLRSLPSAGLSRSVRTRLTLHIGTHKTGSTTIQSTLLSNAGLLEEHGVLYPDAGRNGPGHMRLASAAVSEEERQSGVYPAGSDWADVVWELEAGDCDRVLISSEGFAAAGHDEVRRLLATLDPVFDVDVIVVLRRQDHLVESVHSQNLRVRLKTFEPPKLLEVDHPSLDYEHLLEPWIDVLGPERVQIIEYPETDHARLVPDFLAAAGLDDLGIEAVADENARLHRHALDFIQHHTDLTYAQGRYFDVIAALSEADIPPLAPEHRHFYSPAERASVLEWSGPSTERLSERFFDGQLFAEVPPVDLTEPWEPYPGVSDELVERLEQLLASRGIPPAHYR